MSAFDPLRTLGDSRPLEVGQLPLNGLSEGRAKINLVDTTTSFCDGRIDVRVPLTSF